MPSDRVSDTALDPRGNPAADFLALYDRALPQVFGYIVRRCGVDALAEDLTADVFMAAAAALRNGTVDEIGVGWLIGTARHKLIDHWRRAERQRAVLSLVATDDHTPDRHFTDRCRRVGFCKRDAHPAVGQ